MTKIAFFVEVNMKNNFLKIALAISLLIVMSCSDKETKYLLPVSNSIVPGKCSVTCFTADLMAVFSGVDKVDIALGKRGVLYCEGTDDVDHLFWEWLRGNDNPGCVVWDRATVIGESMQCKIDGLAEDTEYSYCLFLQKRDGSREISAVTSFKTKPFNPVIKEMVLKEVYSSVAYIEGVFEIDDKDAAFCEIGVLVSEQPDVNNETSMVFSTNNTNEGKVSLKIRGLEPGKEYYYRFYLKYPISSDTFDVVYGTEGVFKTKLLNEVEGVDLGLSVKWASYNVGAESPEDYGDYYAWGETETKNNYSWPYYKFWTSGEKNLDVVLNKYNTSSKSGTVDNKTVLDLEDDVAHIAWGGNWRMPTKAELSELQNNCTWTWTTLNSVKGYLVTGKKYGYTDKSIFLPAAGWRNDNYNQSGESGYYRSNTLTEEPPPPQIINIDSESHRMTNTIRCAGLSVRPVCP